MSNFPGGFPESSDNADPPSDASTEALLQKLQADSLIDDESQPASELKPPEKLTEAERRETGHALSLLSTDLSDTFVLSKGLGWEANKAGRFLGTSGTEVENQARDARMILFERLNALIAAWLQGREGLPKTLPLTESEAETARIAFELIPKSNRDSYGRSLSTGESVEKIAEALGLAAEEVEGRIRRSKSLIVLRSEILAISWLREKENGEPRWKRFLRNIEERIASTLPKEQDEKNPNFFFIRAELDEIETALLRLDFAIREAFVLHFWAGLASPGIAAIQGTDEKETFRRLKEGIETIHDRMERLIVAWLRKRMKFPDAARLKPTEGLAAKQAYMAIPEQCREAFVRSRIKGESVQEIASALQISTGKVENRLEEAKNAITDRVVRLSAQAMSQIRNGRQIGEILLDEPEQIGVSSTVRENAGIKIPGHSSLSGTPVVLTPPKNPAYEAVPPKKAQSGKCRTVMASFSGFGLGVAQMEETIKSVLASIWATGFMALAAPFIWIMSLLISGQMSGFAFIRTAPTLEARRWLTEKLFYIYSLVFVGPFAFFYIIGILGITHPKRWQFVGSLYFALLFCTVCIFIFQTSRVYNKLCTLQNANTIKKRSYKKLHFIVNFGFALHTMIYSNLAWQFIQDIYPRLYKETIKVWLVRTLLLTVFIGVIHAAAYFMFRYFLRISKDEKAFEETPPIAISEATDIAGRRILEFLRILPFALFPIIAGVGHFFFKNTRPMCTIIEMIGFTVLWAFVWHVNMTTGKRKTLRVLIYFGIQLAVMAYMRSNYYNPFL